MLHSLRKAPEVFDQTESDIFSAPFRTVRDVGMFVDKQEITLKHTSDEELRKKLREKLGLIIDAESPEIADIEAISHTVVTPKDMKIPFV